MSDIGEVGGVGDIGEDIAEARFVRAYPPARPDWDAPTLYLPFHNGEVVLRDDDTLTLTPPRPFESDEAREQALYIGDLDGVPVVTYTLPADLPLPDGYHAVGLRALFGRLGEDEYGIAGYAVQLLHYREHYKFCSRCGTPTRPIANTWGQECPACGHGVYPPVSPAVLALVHDGGDRVLLAQKPGWGTRYSILAGFVEPGESLEGCAVREVKEEAGVNVVDPVYVGSQPWPFPHQVMVGFTLRHAAGEIKIDETELAHAAWFRYDALPDLPPPLSLSRQIIGAWVLSRQQANGS
jgi:NAD+ diphosphatase